MSFFRRELGPVERFENALREKQAARLKLAAKSKAADAVEADKRKAAEKLAVAGASDAKLARAESDLRTVEERARALRAASQSSCWARSALSSCSISCARASRPDCSESCA